MRIFEKKRYNNGIREIYFVGKKILQYKREPDIAPNNPLQIHKIEHLDQNFIPLVFYWDKVWHEYLNKHNTCELLQQLTEGMDDISTTYIRKFIQLINLLEYKDDILISQTFGWTQRDIEYSKKFEEYQNIEQYSDNEAFIHANQYGLIDLPQDILQKIDGKDIIDGGAYTGDTAILFNQLFPKSIIHAFEPQTINYQTLMDRTKKLQLSSKLVLSSNGLGNKCETLSLQTNDDIDAGASLVEGTGMKANSQIVEVITIDSIRKNEKNKIGLIKLDIEGFEKNALEGAKESIKQDKPVIVAALYHNPVDFFEIKNFLKELNADYKFMVRRSEMVIPLGDIILIAY